MADARGADMSDDREGEEAQKGTREWMLRDAIAARPGISAADAANVIWAAGWRPTPQAEERRVAAIVGTPGFSSAVVAATAENEALAARAEAAAYSADYWKRMHDETRAALAAADSSGVRHERAGKNQLDSPSNTRHMIGTAIPSEGAEPCAC